MKIVHVAEWNAQAGGGFTAASNLVNYISKKVYILTSSFPLYTEYNFPSKRI